MIELLWRTGEGWKSSGPIRREDIAAWTEWLLARGVNEFKVNGCN